MALSWNKFRLNSIRIGNLPNAELKFRLSSVLSFIKCRIKSFQFDTRIFGCELPVDSGIRLFLCACHAAFSIINPAIHAPPDRGMFRIRGRFPEMPRNDPTAIGKCEGPPCGYALFRFDCLRGKNKDRCRKQ